MSNRSFILGWGLVCRRIKVLGSCKAGSLRGIVLFLMFLAILSGRSEGYDNIPVGYGTTPVSGAIGSTRVPGGTYRDGLVRSSNPIDGSGNLIITGNVRGGKYFRGIIPYQSPYSLETGVPSSSLDSFLRDSVGSEDIVGGVSPYLTQPYYSGTKTVTTVEPIGAGFFQPESRVPYGTSASTRVESRVSSKSVLSPLSLQETSVREDVVTPYTNTGLRPLSMNPVELEHVIFEEMEAFSGSKKLADEQHRLRASPLLQNVGEANDKAAEPKQSLLVKNKLLQLPVGTESNGQMSSATNERRTVAQIVGAVQAVDQNGLQQVDIYEQMKQQINNVKRFLEQSAGAESAKVVKDTDKAKGRDEGGLFVAMKAQREKQSIATKKEEKQKLTSSKELPPQPLSQSEVAEGSNVLEEPSEATSGLVPAKGGPSGRAETTPQVSKRESVNEEVDTELKGGVGFPQSGVPDVAAKAREILGEHKTFASFAEDKFNRYMRAAEEYLKRGRYYRAADAYTLAAIYKPDDPLVYAGKSHALFAAGEYMSSALFLSRALEIFPDYGRFKIDLVAMVGDKDRLESRIKNVEQWLDESDAPELKFLLAYVYYQMGRQPEAKEMINAAFEKMPQSSAVVALKKAIANAAE
jgi:tetratricopeptide (TPR) repeat protein